MSELEMTRLRFVDFVIMSVSAIYSVDYTLRLSSYILPLSLLLIAKKPFSIWCSG